MMQTTRNQLVAAVVGVASLAGVTTSQANDRLSGSIALDLNSHFISYGFDVWGVGDDVEPIFNPSLSIDYAITDALTFSTGFWLDINDQSGDWENQETDVWFGLTYAAGFASFGVTYQDWKYGGSSEEILDVAVAFDTILSPSLTWHNRLGSSNTAVFENEDGTGDQIGGFEGSFLVLGLEHSFDLSECFTLTIPFALGYALEEFHTTEDGYGYASLGLQASWAFYDNYSFNFGVTYYDTDDEVVGNDEDSFFTYNAGVSYTF